MKPLYNQSTKEALRSLESQDTGLSNEQFRTRLAQYGPNALKIKGEPLWKKLIEPFRSIFMLILFIAAGISLLMGESLDAIIILIIISISAIIYYVQRFSTERVLRSLKKYEAATVEVWRDGKSLEVPTEDLVPGDIIRLYEGQKVPADARLLQASNLRTDESLLTGESKPANKQSEKLDGDKEVYDQKNMVFSGSFIVEGEATALVTKTGNDTEFGKIAVLAQHRENTSPVQQKIDKHIELTVAVVAVFAAILLILALIRGMEPVEAFHFIIAISVSAIPEGLPVAVTVILVFGMRRMARRKALVRNMAAIENIGLVTTIASDKTGTLTKNQLEVDSVWHLKPQESLDETAAQLTLSVNKKNNVAHDPLDEAFVLFAREHTVETEKFEHVLSLPFEVLSAMSGNVWMHDGEFCIYLKGSPEKILENSTLSPQEKAKVEDHLHDLTSQGLRVVALGRVLNKRVDTLDELEDVPIDFLALIAVADELRPESKEAIAAAQSAGVTVRMITGDHFETAFSIGKQLGLCESRDQVFDSRRIKDMSDEELSETVKISRVFARVIPEHKHRILEVLKEHDITAMTGDGVNDVPALTNAHIGLAMGSGSQIAKDAGDIVLLNNNFKSITVALQEGRKIYDNIRRMLFLLHTTNSGEVCTFLAALILGMPPPVLAVQVLWINLVTDSAMVIPLGLEPAESDIMQRKPRQPNKPILSKTIVIRMTLISIVMATVTLGLFTYFNNAISEDYARTIAFSALVVMQWADAFNARSLWQSIFVRIRTMNKAFYIGLGIAITVHMLAIFGPFQGVLSLEAISLKHFLVTSIIAVVPVIIAGELHKLLIKKIEPDFR